MSFPEKWPSTFSVQGNPDWYDEQWLYRKSITIESDKVGSPLTNFPVFVRADLLGSHFLANVTHGGSEIRITNTAGSQVPREIVEVRADGGEIHFLADSISYTTESQPYFSIKLIRP